MHEELIAILVFNWFLTVFYFDYTLFVMSMGFGSFLEIVRISFLKDFHFVVWPRAG